MIGISVRALNQWIEKAEKMKNENIIQTENS